MSPATCPGKPSNRNALNRKALRIRQLGLLPLIGATYFMVSGGPYGIEDILGGAGYSKAILILLLLPFFWSLPTALMIGELASALPAEGGFYVWVRRGLGAFWGFQEAWLSLTASIFDMAIYPAIFVDYLGQLFPALTASGHDWYWKLLVVALCCGWNLRGASAVGKGSVVLCLLLLAPFAVMIALGYGYGLQFHPPIQWNGSASGLGIATAIRVALWNYMGWDNASTVAQEVEEPQRNYPRAMLASAAMVAVSYLLPLSAVAVAGIPVEHFSTGSWTVAGEILGGHWLAIAVVAGGAMMGFGMFNALMLSYSRLPLAMAQDNMLPRIFARQNSRGVPWVSVLVCGAGWALALRLNFERLISIDLILYGASLLLEFAALIALRLREPQLERPFRAGSLPFAALLGAGPALLLAYCLYSARDERILGISALLFALLVAFVGPLLYLSTRRGRGAKAFSP